MLIGKSRITDQQHIEIPSGLTPQRKEEGFVIVCKDDKLILAGNDEGPYHGTEYAVYDLLERLGMRWYMPGEFGEYVPSHASLDVPEMKLSAGPISSSETGGSTRRRRCSTRNSGGRSATR